MEKPLPAIPAKRYFTIGEVSDLCGVKPYVLRYWEQEFTQLKPMKRRGNRRYYQHHEVLLIRRIRDLLYDQGFTISGARNQLGDGIPAGRPELAEVFRAEAELAQEQPLDDEDFEPLPDMALPPITAAHAPHAQALLSKEASTSLPILPAIDSLEQVRAELLAIRASLTL
jgi:DNA-binding transcriptional MerR regulator